MPTEVAKALVEKFDVWMGHGRKSWYRRLPIGDDTQERLRLRKRMAEINTEEELEIFMEETKIPMKFRPIVLLLRRKVDMRLYKNLMGAISAEKCSEFCGKVKKGMAPGRSRFSVDMAVCLSAPDLKLMRRLVNLVLIPGVSEYIQWKELTSI